MKKAKTLLISLSVLIVSGMAWADDISELYISGDLVIDNVPDRIPYTGSPICPEPVVTHNGNVLVAGTDYTYTCTNYLDEEPDGPVSAGKANVLITGMGQYSGQLHRPFEIAPKSMKDWGFDHIDYVFNTNACPDVNIKDGEKRLVKDLDYEVICHYEDKPHIEVSGINNYTGSTYDALSIISLGFEYDHQPTYTGSPVCPEIVVNDVNGGYVFVEGKDYTVTCKSYDESETDGPVNAGKAYAVITGIGEYIGEEEVYFEIAPKSIANKGFEYEDHPVYTDPFVCPDVVMMDGDKLLEKGQDYEVECHIDLKSTIEVVGINNYTGSSFGPLILEMPLVLSIAIEDLEFEYANQITYTGSPVCPEFVVKDGKYTLVEGEDYTVACKSYQESETDGPVNAGKAYAVITGMNTYTGEKELYFEVTPKSMKDWGFDHISYVFNTNACPDVNIKDGEKRLVKDLDYEVICHYEDKPHIEVAGINNYTGSTYDALSIISLEFEYDHQPTYTGSPVCPEIVVNDVNGGDVFVEGNDYTVTCKSYDESETDGPVNAGKAYAVITGIGEYIGEEEVYFEIARATPVVTAPSLFYTGESQELALSSTFGTVLYSTDGVNYSTEPPTATNADTYKVTFQIEMGNNWEGVEPQVMEVTIEPRKTTYSALEIAEDQDGAYATLDGVYSGQDTIEIEEDVYVKNVAIDRVFKKTSGYSTLMLPFDIEVSKLSGADGVYEFLNVDVENAIVYVKDATSIEAHHPYLVSLGGSLGVEGGVTIKRTVDVSTEDSQGQWVFKGSYGYKKWKEDDEELGFAYGFAGEDKNGASIGNFVRIGAGATIKPYRAYLVYVPTKAQMARYNYTSPIYLSNSNVVKPELPKSMTVVRVEDEQHTTVIGHFNTRSGEFKMKRDFDVMGRHMNAKPRNHKAYYGKKELKK